MPFLLLFVVVRLRRDDPVATETFRRPYDAVSAMDTETVSVVCIRLRKVRRLRREDALALWQRQIDGAATASGEEFPASRMSIRERLRDSSMARAMFTRSRHGPESRRRPMLSRRCRRATRPGALCRTMPCAPDASTCTHNRADVVRIFDAVENHEKRRRGGRAADELAQPVVTRGSRARRRCPGARLPPRARDSIAPMSARSIVIPFARASASASATR